MRMFKNKIITISGEPASGKSTIVKKMKEKFESMGYKVHIWSIGEKFREEAIKEYKILHPEIENPNIADVQSDESFADKRREIDELLDTRVKEKGIQINSQPLPNHVFIFDSRLAWNNIPDSYSIRLIVDENIAGIRAYNDKKRGEEDRYNSVEEAIQKTRERKLAEIERYKERYNVNLSDDTNYNLVMDTSNNAPEQICEELLEKFNEWTRQITREDDDAR